MCEENREQLNAFLDGELTPSARVRLEAHLSECPSCTAELLGLQRVSHLLRASPHPAFTPRERFSSNLLLVLNAQDQPFPQAVPNSRKEASQEPGSGWWLLAPAALAALWIVVQSLLILNNSMALADGNDLFSRAAAWLPTGTTPSLWFMTAMDSIVRNVHHTNQSGLVLLDRLTQLMTGFLGAFFWQAVVALPYCIWIAAWWQHGHPRSFRSSSTPQVSQRKTAGNSFRVL